MSLEDLASDLSALVDVALVALMDTHPADPRPTPDVGETRKDPSRESLPDPCPNLDWKVQSG